MRTNWKLLTACSIDCGPAKKDNKRTQPGRRKIWQAGWDNKYMIWQVGGGLAGMDGVSRIAGIAGWDGGAKHFYGFFCPPEGTFEHYQHFRVRVRNGGSGETGDDYRPLIL